MNKYIIGWAIFLALTLSACGSAPKEYYLFTSFHEPATEGLRFLYSEDGLHWDSIPGIWLRPAVGKQQVMRDPSMVRTPDGVFHLVWTSSWKGDLGFGYASSKDLIHWSEQQLIHVMNDTTTVNVWAPELFYDETEKQFIVVWASCVPNRFPNGDEEEKNNHRLYYITTKDFQTISDTKLFYDPGFSCIDATIVKRADADYVMVLKDNSRPNRNLKVAFATSPYGPYSAASLPFTESFTEGPTVAHLGRQYYIYFDAYKKKTYEAVKTTDFIHFYNANADISIPNGHKHGTIFKASKEVVEKMLTLSKPRKES
ncbi:MAG: glycoside hydrolase family 43 protein [Prevotellaceae bacterium]|nr:glycoside hydrolase family 43 protein [Prevotellaceae bacterium]